MDFKDFTILYVEDEKIIRSNVEKCLSYIFNVLVAENGQDGIDIFKNNEIDLIITDIYMPKKDGISMLIDIKKLKPTIPCIITSAHNPIILDKSLTFEPCNYIVKPFDIKDLLNRSIKLLKLI